MNFIKGTFKFVLGCVLVALITTTFVADLVAQNIAIPTVPRLSLLGDDGGYDEQFYPDGRLWLPTAENEPRQFLLPVFMNNNWFNYYEQDNNRKKYIPNPIKSFKFSLMYDETTLQAEGVEVLPPEYMSDMVYADEILARNFNFICDDVEDDNYWFAIDENHWSANKQDREQGRRFTITATSSEALPNSDNADRGDLRYNILCFVRFTVIAKPLNGQNVAFISKKPLYIDNREILYNDMDATTDRPIVELSDYPITQAMTDYPGPSPKILTGIDNSETTLFNTEPYRVGSISVHFFGKFPEFELKSNADDNPVLQMQENGEDMPGMYSLYRPISVDSNANDAIANIQVQLNNKQSATRLMFPQVESDNAWLLFKTDKNLGENYIQSYKQISRADIPYIDNNILGEPDPMGDATIEQGPIYLDIKADPTKIEEGMSGDDEKTGSYVGWISFRAPFAEVNPIKLRVPFTYIKNPEEMPAISAPGETGGITLSIYNSDGVAGEKLDMVIGTGRRATIVADALYGEEAYTTALSTTAFDARLYAVNEIVAQYDQQLWDNGFRDVAPNRYSPRTHSRDIRQYSEDITTYTFNCKFNSGGVDKYPVVLEWDISDFPKNALVYLKDSENGKLFPAIDMRKATNIGGTRYSYTFNDARIKEFFIEYSLPQTFQFVDESGAASIQTGWNMLSMPVLPLNTRYDEMYTNSVNTPYYFSLSQHEPVPNAELNFGQGYFIKYSSIIDVDFVGSMISSIPAEGQDPVMVYPTDKTIDANDPQADEYGGWNLVGTISYPTAIDGLEFDAYQGGLQPDPVFTKKFGFWKYEPKHGYKEVRVLHPGFGYWIKTNRYGYYKLGYTPLRKQQATPTESILADNVEMTIRDNAQNIGTLYLSNNANINAKECQLPPCPPAGVFDVRFEGSTYLSNANESVIELQGVDYPANIFIANSPAEYMFSDAVTGKVFGSISKGFSGNISIDKAAANAVKMTKVNTEVATGEAFEVYPNPATAVSTINFSIPTASFVSVKLYNEMGNEVMTIKNAQLSAGNYSEVLDVNGLSAGNYICRLTYGVNSSVVKVTVIK